MYFSFSCVLSKLKKREKEEKENNDDTYALMQLITATERENLIHVSSEFIILVVLTVFIGISTFIK